MYVLLWFLESAALDFRSSMLKVSFLAYGLYLERQCRAHFICSATSTYHWSADVLGIEEFQAVGDRMFRALVCRGNGGRNWRGNRRRSRLERWERDRRGNGEGMNSFVPSHAGRWLWKCRTARPETIKGLRLWVAAEIFLNHGITATPQRFSPWKFEFWFSNATRLYVSSRVWRRQRTSLRSLTLHLSAFW